MTPVEALTRYQQQYGRLRDEVQRRILAVWAAVGGVSDDDAARFTSVAVPIAEAGQVSAARLAAAHIALTSRLVTGSALAAVIAANSTTTQALRGVAADQVYLRPVVEARTSLSQSRPYDQAMEAGAQRADQLALSGLMLAQRAGTLQALASDQRIVGYRRVLTGKSCAFCATASTQRYYTGQLMPLHTHCDCSVAPIYGTTDPGHVINSDLLRDMKANGSPEYWKDKGWGVDESGVVRHRREVPVLGDDGTPQRTTSGKVRTTMELGDPVRPVVRTHGELGPTLVDPRHGFIGPADIAA